MKNPKRGLLNNFSQSQNFWSHHMVLTVEETETFHSWGIFYVVHI